MPFRNFEGTILPRSGFDAAVSASMLEKAMKGSGCDQREIRRVITAMNNSQRQIVREEYKKMYEKDLVDELKKELSGDFEYVICALMEPPSIFDAIQLNSAVKGLGTTESVLVDVLCTRSNEEIQQIKSAYLLKFGKELEKDIIGDTSGDFQQILVALLKCARDQSDNVDVNSAREDAKQMLGNKELKVKPDKDAYKIAFSTQNYQQLEALFDEYQLLSGYSIQKGIEKLFSGDARTAYLAIVESMYNAPQFFAHRLYETMKGFGTDDLGLVGIVVSRSEIDLAEISKKFEQKYHKSLIDYIKSDCSGEYCETLIRLVKGNRQ